MLLQCNIAFGCTGRTRSYGVCPACGGKGVSARFWCKKCGGEGRAETPCQFRVKIPGGVLYISINGLHVHETLCDLSTPRVCKKYDVTGVDHGSVLRLNGQGDVGTFGGKRGDIMLRFLVCAMRVRYVCRCRLVQPSNKTLCSSADKPRGLIYPAWK